MNQFRDLSMGPSLGLPNGVSLHYFVPEILVTAFLLAVILLDLSPKVRRGVVP